MNTNIYTAAVHSVLYCTVKSNTHMRSLLLVGGGTLCMDYIPGVYLLVQKPYSLTLHPPPQPRYIFPFWNTKAKRTYLLTILPFTFIFPFAYSLFFTFYFPSSFFIFLFSCKFSTKVMVNKRTE
jgi:hypothetical protein